MLKICSPLAAASKATEAYEITLVELVDGEEVELELPAEKTTAFGIYGTANLIDGLTLNAEFGSRKIEWKAKGLKIGSLLLCWPALLTKLML